MFTSLIAVPESKQAEFEHGQRELVAQVKALGAIDSSEKLATAEPLACDLRRYATTVEDFFAEPIAHANAAHKFLTGLRSRFASPARELADKLGRQCGDYRRRLREEEDRQREEARRKAEAEANAENARRRAEHEKAQREAEERARQEQEAQALARASELEAQGRTQEAEAVVQAAITATPEVSVPEPELVVPTPEVVGTLQPEKPSNVSYRKTWKFTVTDEAQVKREFLKIDEAAIRKVVTSLGRTAETVVGGIKVEEDTTPVYRRK